MRTRELRAIGRPNRRYFIGGSDARVIMGDDEAALLRLCGKSGVRSSPRTFRAISLCS